MMIGWRCAIAVFAMAVGLALSSAVTPASAQQGDLRAIYKRYNEFYTAGNYPAALVEARKLEAA